jgi:hypothetical protein
VDDNGEDRRSVRGRGEDYRYARIAVALTMAVAMGFLLLADAMRTDYEVQPTTLVTIGMLILGLLGLEARDILKR